MPVKGREMALSIAAGAFIALLLASSALGKVEDALQTISKTIAQMEQHRDSVNGEAAISNFLGAIAHGLDGNYGWGADREYERREADQSRQSLLQQAYAYQEEAAKIYSRTAGTRNWSLLVLLIAGGFGGYRYWKDRQKLLLTPPPLPPDPV